MNIRRLLLATMIGVILILTVLPALAQETSVTVNATTLTRVRSGTGTTYSIIGFLVEGDSFSATGRNGTGNDWLRINYDGEEGWVAASVVTVDGDPTTLSIVSAASAESVVGNTDATITTEDTVNVRVGPSTTYRVIDQLDSGSVFDVTGRTAISFPLVCRGSSIIDPTEGDSIDNVWLRINLGGFSAWVAYSAVSTDGNICDVDEISSDEAVSTPEGLPSLDGQAIVVTQVNVNLRASNYPTSEVLDIIPYGTTLVAEARDEDSLRVRVTYEDQTGWISLSNTEVIAGSIDSLPVEEE